MFQNVSVGSERSRGLGGGGLALVALVTAAGSTAAGFAIGSRWLLPALNALAIYPFYVELILARQRRKAVALALMWAIFLSQAVIAGTYFFPARAEQVIVRGGEYKAEMLDWVRTGEGKESTPSRFIPEHARDFAIFCALAVATGGLGALFLGAVLLNFMNFYVGALVAASADPPLTLLVAWQPYAMIRVAGYIIVATALAEVSIGLVTRHRPRWPAVRRYAIFGAALVVADVVVKVFTSPYWSRLVRWTSGIGET